MKKLKSDQIEIMFKDASKPKICNNVVTVYTKGGLICIEYKSGLIIKYPPENIWSIAQYHQPHYGSTNPNDC